MRRFPLVILLVALDLLPMVAWAQDVDWRVLRTRHFLVYCADGAESTAERAGSVAEEWYGKLSRKLKFAPGNDTPIYLYPDRRSFSEATGVGRGERIVGLAHAHMHRIRVDASGAFADVEHIIPHELAHVFLSRRLRGNALRAPLWVHEGLAKYLAEDWTGRDAELLADAASGSEILPLRKISQAFPPEDNKQSVAYVQSYSAIKYMADTYSPESILDLLAELGAGQPFETALFNSIGRTSEEFEAEWRQYLWEEYRLGRWVKLGSGLVSAAMVLLAILAFRARILQKRRKAEEFEE